MLPPFTLYSHPVSALWLLKLVVSVNGLLTKFPNCVFDGVTVHQVVCGAPNVAAGQRVAFARAGAKLPGGLEMQLYEPHHPTAI